MMFFLFMMILLAGPRIGIFFWWLFNPERWERAFDTVIWPFLGFLFAPWTTLTFVIVSPNGTIAGFDWMWLTLGLLVDISGFAGGYSRRRSSAGYPTYY